MQHRAMTLLSTIRTVAKTAGILVMATAMTVTAAASEIYKWVDADGNVQYGDRPSGADSEVQLQIASRPTDPERIEAQAAAKLEQQANAREAASAAAANEPQGPSEEELRNEARERAEKCTMYRARLEKFVQSRRLYREDTNGERVYLDEAETQAARENVQHQVEEYCSP
jgi:Domain of unknown function (DUF4124)